MIFLIIITSYLSVGLGVYLGAELVAGSKEMEKVPTVSAILWFVLLWPYTIVAFQKPKGDD